MESKHPRLSFDTQSQRDYSSVHACRFSWTVLYKNQSILLLHPFHLHKVQCNVHNPDLHGWNSQNESDKDAHWKIRIKPVKLTNLSMTQALFDP